MYLVTYSICQDGIEKCGSVALTESQVTRYFNRRKSDIEGFNSWLKQFLFTRGYLSVFDIYSKKGFQKADIEVIAIKNMPTRNAFSLKRTKSKVIYDRYNERELV